MIHRALRYLVWTRIKNRVGGWLRRLRTLSGILGAALLVLVVLGIVVGTTWGAGSSPEEQQGMLVMILGFFLVTSVLSGLGQRGLVFSPADLDFLFPAPFPRRHLVAYQFVPHYILAALMPCMFIFLFGGRYLAHPVLFGLGVFLCHVTIAHLSAAAAEVSMLLADTVFKRLRPLVITLAVLLTIGAMLLLVASLGGWADVPAELQRVASSDALRVLLFPAQQAVQLGAATEVGAQLLALGALLACVAASFALVLLIPADVVEGSIASSQRAHKRVQEMRRGVRAVKVKRSDRGPRSRLFRGAGAVLWLNWVTLRRQLRAMLGGLFVVLVIFLVVGARGGERGEAAMGRSLLSLLAMVPLWMPLPVGFRLPREQLVELRGLPLSPTRLASALLVVPVLAPFVLQVAGVTVLLTAGHLTLGTALAALPAYFAASGTLLTVEGMFVLRRPQPNAVNLLLSVGQIMLQMVALLPGIVVLTVIALTTRLPPLALLAAAVAQMAVTVALVGSLGRQLHTREVHAVAA